MHINVRLLQEHSFNERLSQDWLAKMVKNIFINSHSDLGIGWTFYRHNKMNLHACATPIFQNISLKNKGDIFEERGEAAFLSEQKGNVI